MAIRTGKVIIAKNIKLDKSYKNVLNYNEQQMLTLINSKKVSETGNCSFIKVGDTIIDTDFSYDDALKCNYMAIQNPYYSNKWFFAFIDSVEYISNGNARIHYTIDEFSTWFDYWNSKACFVIREHVNDDSIGSNTVPENLETGEFIMMSEPQKLNNFDGGAGICITVSDFPSDITVNYPNSINNIYSGLKYCIFQHSNWTTACEWADEFINKYDSNAKADAIISIFMIPKKFGLTDHAHVITYGEEGHFFYIPNETTTFNTLVESVSVSMNNTLGGEYVPKNNKLLTAPFNYFVVSNNAGTDVVFNYEDFINNSPSFKIIGAVAPGCSIKCVPLNYKKIADSNGSMNSYNYGIEGAKLPICAWSNDTYTNWLTQNGVNTAIGIVGGIALAGIGIAGAAFTGGTSLAITGAVVSGAVSVGASVGSVYQHSLAPDQARGNVSVGDVNFSAGNSVFTVYKMGLREEYAKMIDDYMSRMGYKVNKIKIPNQTGRHYWNYVQIGAEEDIGYSTNQERSVPASSMETINNIYRAGVTIWHNHDQLGNYDLNNNIL